MEIPGLKMLMQAWATQLNTRSVCFTPHLLHAILLYCPLRYTPFLNLCPLIFGLTPFDWLCCVLLAPTHSIISYWNNISFIYAHFFQEHS